MTRIEANGDNGQERLDLPRSSFHTFFFFFFLLDGGEQAWRRVIHLEVHLDSLCVFISHFSLLVFLPIQCSYCMSCLGSFFVFLL